MKAIGGFVAVLASTGGAGSLSLAATGPHGSGTASSMMVNVPTNAWIGQWAGKRGTSLSIAAQGGEFSGRYRVTIKTEGGKQERFEGLAHLDTIVFLREGHSETIRGQSGAKPCLIIGPNEQYCRG